MTVQTKRRQLLRSSENDVAGPDWEDGYIEVQAATPGLSGRFKVSKRPRRRRNELHLALDTLEMRSSLEREDLLDCEVAHDHSEDEPGHRLALFSPDSPLTNEPSSYRARDELNETPSKVEHKAEVNERWNGREQVRDVGPGR